MCFPQDFRSRDIKKARWTSYKATGRGRPSLKWVPELNVREVFVGFWPEKYLGAACTPWDTLNHSRQAVTSSVPEKHRLTQAHTQAPLSPCRDAHRGRSPASQPRPPGPQEAGPGDSPNHGTKNHKPFLSRNRGTMLGEHIAGSPEVSAGRTVMKFASAGEKECVLRWDGFRHSDKMVSGVLLSVAKCFSTGL